MADSAVPEVPGYTVGRELGRGASATVWLVTEKRTGRNFALKCYRPDLASPDPELDGNAGSDARREVRILSVLDHQHLLKAHESVRLPAVSGGGLGLLVDYAPGGSLAHLVASRGKLSIGETVTVLTPIAQALGYLHGKGFTHSDVSPGNVLFTSQGKPLLADVGIARVVGDPAAVAGHGTGGFMDPAPVDAVRAGLQPERDVYSLAAVGWFCLTGKAPGRTAERPPLPLLLPDVPEELAAALEAGLNEDRRLRPTALELAGLVYRSAAPLPVDLAGAVHPTVVPELLTRRPLPASGPAGLSGTVRAWKRRLSTSRWSTMLGYGQMLPFPVEGAGAGGHRRADDAKLPLLKANGRRPARSPGPRAERGSRPGRVKDIRGKDSGSRAAGQPAGKRAVKPAGKVSGKRAGKPAVKTAGKRARKHAGRTSWTARGRSAGALLVLASALVALGGAAWWAAGQGIGAKDAGQQAHQAGAGTAYDDGHGSAGSMQAGTAGPAVPRGITEQLESDDPAVAVRGLASLRSLALSSGQLELLEHVNVDGSTAELADEQLSAPLRESGHVLAGFSSILADVEVQPGTTEGRARVGVTSSTTSYVEQDRTGATVAQGTEAPAQELVLVLEKVAGKWRVAEIRPGP